MTDTRYSLLETMPDELRSSHRTAGNWGAYPQNGSHREWIPEADAIEIVDADPDNYSRIVASGYRCTINERGNGLPDPGAYVPGDNGRLFRIIATEGFIQTGPTAAGIGNWVDGYCEPVDWDDVDESDVFRAHVALEAAE